jgi:hypothetical protein
LKLISLWNIDIWGVGHAYARNFGGGFGCCGYFAEPANGSWWDYCAGAGRSNDFWHCPRHAGGVQSNKLALLEEAQGMRMYQMRPEIFPAGAPPVLASLLGHQVWAALALRPAIIEIVIFATSLNIEIYSQAECPLRLLSLWKFE